jgi:hypothetical protein
MYRFAVVAACALLAGGAGKPKFQVTPLTSPDQSMRYINGEPIVVSNKQGCKTALARQSPIIESSDRVVLVLMASNNTAQAVNVDEAAIRIMKEDGSPLSIVPHHVAMEEASRRMARTRRAAQGQLGLMALFAPGRSTRRATGSISGQSLFGPYSEQIVVDVPDPQADEHNRQRLEKRASEIREEAASKQRAIAEEAEKWSFRPVTIEPGSDGATAIPIMAQVDLIGNIRVTFSCGGEAHEFMLRIAPLR